jgi:hypothetical protein
MRFKFFRRRHPIEARAIGERRMLIIHNHVFKNAGTTIDWALQRNFGDRFVDHRDDVQMRKGAAYLGPYILEHQQVRALSTHHLVFPLPEIAGIELVELMTFRHPIERVASVYHFERKQTIDIPGTIHARKLSLRDYVVWRMRPDVGATIRNNHVRKLLPPRKLSEERIQDFEMSGLKDRLKQLPMLGLVERFEDSMVLFEAYLRKEFPSIDLSYVPQNVGRVERDGLEDQLEHLKLEIGNDVFELLIQKNQEDLLLYEWAKEEFESRVALVPDFPQQLADLRDRCRAL